MIFLGEQLPLLAFVGLALVILAARGPVPARFRALTAPGESMTKAQNGNERT
jgi:hypothetical protein